MSPTPLIELQRRLTLVGAIRAGGEKQPRAPGRKLEAFRLTSPRETLLRQAAELYGGTVSPWQSPTGNEYQLYTEAPELPVLVMPGYSLRQSYELWEGATKRLRVCDGIEEELSGGACICNAEEHDVCDLYTRLVVALPELDTVLGWRLITKGAYAGHELPTMMTLLENRAGHTFVPARLRLDQRRGVKDGQVVRFVVPTLDLGIGYLALASATPQPSNGGPQALPPGYTPAQEKHPSVSQALEAVERLPERSSRGRRPAPFAPTNRDMESRVPLTVTHEDTAPPAPAEPIPIPVAEPAAEAPASAFPIPPAVAEEAYQERRQTLRPTPPMIDKLNFLVGTLRDAGKIHTAELWNHVAFLRDRGGNAIAQELGGYDEDGTLHWSPLRESLTRPEAAQLLDLLEAKAAK